jgi:hypothetical protein
MVYFEKSLYIFSNKIMVGTKWKNKSNMSIGLVNVPFLSMINFSNTWGIGLNGARIMKTAMTIRIEYGILSTNAHMITLMESQN